MEKKVSEFNPQWLRRQILEEGKTYAKVGKILGISRERVRQYCLKYKISLKQRKGKWYAKYFKIPELETPNWLLWQKAKGDSIGLGKLAKKLGISSQSLKNQIRRLGLEPEHFRARAQRITLTCYWCGNLIERKVSEIRRRKHNFCSRTCLGKWLATNYGWGKAWTEKEDEFIRKNWQKMTDREMTEHLPERTESGIGFHRSAVLGLKEKPWAQRKKERK